MRKGGRSQAEEKGTMGDTYSLVRLSNPEKAPLVSSIVPEMSLWSSSLWRTREKRGMRKRDGRRRTGPGLAGAEVSLSPGLEGHGLPPRSSPQPRCTCSLDRLCSASQEERRRRRRGGSACLLVDLYKPTVVKRAWRKQKNEKSYERANLPP